MNYRIDLHCHSRFSADGVSEPEEMVQVAKERGLHGFAITDHNTCACVDYFLSVGLMREDGQPVDGFLILPGQEITTSAGNRFAISLNWKRSRFLTQRSLLKEPISALMIMRKNEI